jgi:hypothetical protein
MRRRDFIKGIVGSATAWPHVARSQQSAMPVVGSLISASQAGYESLMGAVLKGLPSQQNPPPTLFRSFSPTAAIRSNMDWSSASIDQAAM